jgi:hypothetical protein
VTPAVIERRNYERAPTWFDKDKTKAPPERRA